MAKTSSIRILSGNYRSRLIKFRPLPCVRPTLGMVRKTLFNWLEHDLSGSSCLDLFAGSGILGFECLSHNASLVTMVEINSCQDLYDNQNALNIDSARLSIIRADACNYLKQCTQCFDLILLDPPYVSHLLSASLQIIHQRKLLSHNGQIFIEYSRRHKPDPLDFVCHKTAKYGDTVVSLLKMPT